MSTCLFTRLEESSGPSRISDSSVSAENVIYEAFVLLRKLSWIFSSWLQWRKKSEDKSICHPSSFLLLPLFLKEGSKEKHHPIFPKNKKQAS